MKRNILYLILSFFLCIIFNLSAQIDFEEHILIDNLNLTDAPTSVHTADLDGDGDMDVLSASHLDDKIAWYENIDGLGKFGNQQIISSNANGARSVFAIDLDGDGDMDVLSASRSDDKIAWYENEDGLGDYGNQQIISLNANGARSVFAADIDGDGYIDVLSASSSDGKIAWYGNENGLGSFGNQQIITINAAGAISVYAADIDNDGDMDVLSASQGDDKIAWYENEDGLGNFGDQQVVTILAENAQSVYAADIDNDGDLDILSASVDDNKVAWYENTDGLGDWGSQQIISQNANYATSVYATDIDNDGDMDVLSASVDDNKIAWYENQNGLGSFGEQQVISLNAKVADAVYTADLDGDGDMDVLSASFGDDRIAWYENLDGLGDFGKQRNINYSTNKAKAIYATDIDGDNDLDILSTSECKITWHENLDGYGDFSSPQEISIDIEISNGTSVYATDIDEDGDMDILSSSYVNDQITWHENVEGQGDLWESQTISSNEDKASGIYAADLDGDGDMDVLSSSEGDDQISWFNNEDGLGNFGAQQIINQNVAAPNEIYSFDLDGDGDLDVLSAAAAKITWYENEDGIGTFGTEQTIRDNITYAWSAFASDIDGDGDLDVLSIGTAEVLWFENMDGQGDFGTGQMISTDLMSCQSVYAIDMDNDGDIDVLTASIGDDKIAWYENLDGLGNFGMQHIISTNALQAWDVYAADIDDDGDIDVLSASHEDGKIAWYENRSIVATHSPNDSSSLDFQVSPNPTSGLLHIQASTEITQIEIYNSLGQLLVGNRNNDSIDLSNLSKGLYLCKVQDENGTWGIRKICIK